MHSFAGGGVLSNSREKEGIGERKEEDWKINYWNIKQNSFESGKKKLRSPKNNDHCNILSDNENNFRSELLRF